MRTLLALLLPLALALPAAADCCEGWCHGFSTDAPETPAGQYYVALDPPCQPECLPSTFTLWIYEETNGLAGLQRGGNVCQPLDGWCYDDHRDDTCGGRFLPDRLIF